MPIIPRKKQSEFRPAPEGLWPAVCCDVYEPWTEERPQEFGGGLTDKTRLAWQISEIDPENGKPFLVTKKYTLSLHEKSNLSRDLETWRGKRFTEEERGTFDVERLIGVNCQVQVVHAHKDGTTFANVMAVLPLTKGLPVMKVTEYTRKKDRDKPAAQHVEDEQDSTPF